MKGLYKDLYEKIDEILWADWDPIGLNNNEDIRDEYSSYVPYIVKLKMSGADIVKISSYLYHLESVVMGMGGNMNRCKDVALEILNI